MGELNIISYGYTVARNVPPYFQALATCWSRAREWPVRSTIGISRLIKRSLNRKQLLYSRWALIPALRKQLRITMVHEWIVFGERRGHCFFASEMVQSSEGGSHSAVHANFAFDSMNKGTPSPATYCRLHRELPDQKQLSSRLSSAATRLVRAQGFSSAFCISHFPRPYELLARVQQDPAKLLLKGTLISGLKGLLRLRPLKWDKLYSFKRTQFIFAAWNRLLSTVKIHFMLIQHFLHWNAALGWDDNASSRHLRVPSKKLSDIEVIKPGGLINM